MIEILLYIIIFGYCLFMLGLFNMLFLVIKMTYEAIKEREWLYICAGIMGTGFLIMVIATLLDVAIHLSGWD